MQGETSHNSDMWTICHKDGLEDLAAICPPHPLLPFSKGHGDLVELETDSRDNVLSLDNNKTVFRTRMVGMT